MRGIQCLKKKSAPARPPVEPHSLFGPVQDASCPSLHKLGVMKANLGVVAALERSRARWPDGAGRPVVNRFPRGTSLELHSAAASVTEWNQTNGLWRVAYWSVGVATWAAGPPVAGCPQSVPPVGSDLPPSRAGSLPMSCS